jgi:hypothetical protein
LVKQEEDKDEPRVRDGSLGTEYEEERGEERGEEKGK